MPLLQRTPRCLRQRESRIGRRVEIPQPTSRPKCRKRRCAYSQLRSKNRILRVESMFTNINLRTAATGHKPSYYNSWSDRLICKVDQPAVPIPGELLQSARTSQSNQFPSDGTADILGPLGPIENSYMSCSQDSLTSASRLASGKVVAILKRTV